MSLFIPLQKELRSYLPKKQVALIHDAYLFAAEAHQEQARFTGEPYITHPIAVATHLAKLHMDPQTIMAALLHDVLEDTEVTENDLTEKFGKEVTQLVDGVTKLTKISFETHAEAQAENFRKMIMAMVDDIRVILVKLADRLHNMRTLSDLPWQKRRRIAKETLEIYVPIANRLGMNTLRLELEELGFQMLFPLRFRVLKNAVIEARGNRKEIIGVIEEALYNTLKKAKISKFKLSGREKHIYSIYRKMKNKHLSFSEVMDVYAFRITVHKIDECYRVLGVVHTLYKPRPEKFKDYIAIPKVNGYQSLHTTLFGPYGVPVEIQIRTEEMDNVAENGIAAHWLYKSEDRLVDQAQLRAREWIQGLMELQQKAGDSLEFIENVKIDLFPDEVYVFTPKGKIFELPAGATAVDFAYAIHSDIGNSCVAVKIDRRLSPLSTQLSNGQSVEVITAPGACPNPSWLNFVVTGKARSAVRHYLKHQRRKESVILGKRLLERALESKGSSINQIPKKNLDKLLSDSGVKSINELFEQIGLGNQLAQIVACRLLKCDELELLESQKDKIVEPLRIKGTEGVVVTFASCCYPIPGDPIEGVLTEGQGIVVHHAECDQLLECRRQPDKCIPVSWEEDIQGQFSVEILVYVVDQRGVFATLATAIANAEANIENISVLRQEGGSTILKLILTVHDREHLAHVLRRIRQLKCVSKVIRANEL